MAWVRKANVILEVKTDEEAERYLDMGYNIIDEYGNILKACIPSDLGTLRHFYVEHTKEIERLKSHIAELEEQLKKATTKSAAQKTSKSKKAER